MRRFGVLQLGGGRVFWWRRFGLVVGRKGGVLTFSMYWLTGKRRAAPVHLRVVGR